MVNRRNHYKNQQIFISSSIPQRRSSRLSAFRLVLVDQAIECETTRGLSATSLLLRAQPCIHLALRPACACVVLGDAGAGSRDLFLVQKIRLSRSEVETLAQKRRERLHLLRRVGIAHQNARHGRTL